MPNYFRTQSPWTAAAQGADSLSELPLRIMQLKLQAAQMRESQDVKRQTLDIQRQRMQSQTALDQAKMGLLGSQGGLADAKTVEQGDMTDTANLAGVAAFGKEMVGTPGYDPNSTSMLPNTPENQLKIIGAQLLQHLTRSAASQPQSAASLLQPRGFDATKNVFNAVGQHEQVGVPAPIKMTPNSSLLNPSTGGTIGFGPSLLSGNARYTQDPGAVEENPQAAKGSQINWGQVANQLSSNLTKRREQNISGKAPVGDTEYDSMAALLQKIMPYLQSAVPQLGGGTNNLIPPPPMQGGTTNRIKSIRQVQ